jgi:acyl carrier protein
MLTRNLLIFLECAAEDARVEMPGPNGSLFNAGVLDSFSLVDFVAAIETEYGISVGDADLRPENFETLAKVEAYIERARAGQ